MAILFFISIGFIVYTYAVYPLIVYVWGTVFPKKVQTRYEFVPVSIVLAVRNGEEHIESRLQDLMSQDYPAELVDIIIVSNGSTDKTVEIAKSIRDPRVRVIEIEEPVGKAGAINVGVGSAKHDIVVFADVRQSFGEAAISELVAVFFDERVGAVSGELIIGRTEESEVKEGVGLYWEYEKLIRRKESEIDSVVGATGSIYAIRRSLYVPLPPQTLLDDFLVPMRIVLQGFRVVFARSAKAYDRTSGTSSHEFSRKVRTLAGNFQALAFESNLLNPAKNRVFFQMISHKLARLAVPYFFVLALLTNLSLRGTFWDITLAIQLLFYLAILLRFTPLKKSRYGGIVRVAWTFAVLNTAAVVGLWVFATGKDKEAWRPDRT
ncbi:MAG: glycosyltransferase family 2 protein [Candidatus Latescibacterota bacterium]|nr:MAG: glycosyltransferase family 2 protein [Candidatus Latescibacterota bacterium]